MSFILKFTSGKCITRFKFFNLINNFCAVHYDILLPPLPSFSQMSSYFHIIGSLEALWVRKIKNSGKFSDKMQIEEARIANQRGSFYFKLDETTRNVNTVTLQSWILQ